jgi:hypothetical protein
VTGQGTSELQASSFKDESDYLRDAPRKMQRASCYRPMSQRLQLRAELDNSKDDKNGRLTRNRKSGDWRLRCHMSEKRNGPS